VTIHDLHAPERSGTWTASCISIALGLVLLLACSVTAWPQETGEADADPETPNRITRLQDALSNAQEWDIGVPEPQATSPFDNRIRAGTALNSAAYLALDAELRQLRQTLAERPDDEQAREQLGKLRRALAARAESNMDLGYLYAARVYIALLEDAGAPPEQVATYLERLDEINRS